MRTPSKFKNMEYRQVLLELVGLFSPKTYLELGTKNGYTFNAISPLVDRAYGVDIKLQPSVKRADNVELFECNTVAFFQMFKKKNKKIDFIFIDADHNRLPVLTDIANSTDIIEPYTGLIFVHDTYPKKTELLAPGYCSNSWLAIKDLKERISSTELEILTFPGPWAGMTVLRSTPKGKYGWMD